MSTHSYPPYESSDSVWQGQNQSGSGVSSGSGPANPYQLQQNGFAVASLVLGIVGVVFGAIPLVGLFFSPLLVIGFILGVVAIVLVYKNMRGRKVMSIIATILNAFGMVVAILSTTALFGAAEYVSNADGVVSPAESSTSAPASPGASSAPAKSKVPAEHRAALGKAELYANTMHMSKAAVGKQLTSEFGEKFSPEAAKYAVDNVKADWKKNALTKANEYQDTMNMSPEAIRKQLVSSVGEQFTKEEADYAVKNLDK